MWQRDGWEVDARLGVLTAHAAVGAESELRAMAPAEIGIHAARAYCGAMGRGGTMAPTIPLGPIRAFADPPFVDDAAELLAAAPLEAIGFAFTSSGYAIGPEGEAAMVARLEERTEGIPLTTSCAAAAEALRALEVERLAIVNPPWFGAELDSLGSEYFRAAGIEVVHAASVRLPSRQQGIEPQGLFDSICGQVPEHAGGIFIAGNGLRSAGVVEALERELGRPVVTANQGLLWAMLALAGSEAAVSGYGQLFERLPA
jgi:maleate isomerase